MSKMQNASGDTPNSAAPARLGFTGQPTFPSNGASPAVSLINNNNPSAMRVSHQNAYTQHRPVQQIFPAQQQMANINGNTYPRAMRGASGASMPMARGNVQGTQQAMRTHRLFSGHHGVNRNGRNAALPMVQYPTAMNAGAQLSSAVTPQARQMQYRQQYQAPAQPQNPHFSTPQQFQNHQQIKNPQQYVPQQPQSQATASTAATTSALVTTSQASLSVNRTIPSGYPPITPISEHHISSDTPSNTVSPLNAGNPHSVHAVEPARPSTNTEGPEDFQKRVKALVKEDGTSFGGHIWNDSDYDRYAQGVWEAKLKHGFEQRANDCPIDEAGQLAVRKRIFDAFVNLGGEQDSISETADSPIAWLSGWSRSSRPLRLS